MVSVGAFLILAVVAPNSASPAAWITPYDYPQAALREDRSGHTGFQLTISTEGKPIRCEIIYQSGWEDLDRVTCNLLMRRARFTPAFDAKGIPTIAVYRNVNSFYIPGAPSAKNPKPSTTDMEIGLAIMPKGIPAPAELRVAFEVDPNGAISECTPVLKGSAAYGPARPSQKEKRVVEKLGPVGCEQLAAGYKAVPATNERGEAVRSIQTAKLMFVAGN